MPVSIQFAPYKKIRLVAFISSIPKWQNLQQGRSQGENLSIRPHLSDQLNSSQHAQKRKRVFSTHCDFWDIYLIREATKASPASSNYNGLLCAWSTSLLCCVGLFN